MDIKRCDLDALNAFMRHRAIEYGRRVTELRLARGLSGPALAQQVGCNAVTMWRIEGGVLSPKDHIRLAIAAVLGVEVEDLWKMPRISEVEAFTLEVAA